MEDMIHTLTPEIEIYMRIHYPLKGGRAIAKVLNASPLAVRSWSRQLGLKMTPEAFKLMKSTCKIKEPSDYRVNPDQFAQVRSADIAYLLGLAWADGSIRAFARSGILGFNNQVSDMKDIEAVFKRTGDWSFYPTPKQRPSWKDQMIVRTSGALLYRFLEAHDYASKSKSPDKILAHIPEHLRHYWWRGYFDGDGCLYLGHECHQVIFAGPYEQDWGFAVKLCKRLGVRYAVAQRVSKKGHRSSTFRVSGIRNCKALLGPIYEGYENDQIGFKRKRAKYEELRDIIPKR